VPENRVDTYLATLYFACGLLTSPRPRVGRVDQVHGIDRAPGIDGHAYAAAAPQLLRA
jgi:hypothetical protein